MKTVIAMNGRGKQMDDLINRLSEIRSEYNCFDEKEESYYHALSEAIEILSKRADGDTIRINLNEWIKVKLTDWGKEIYYHQYDRINQIAGRKVCEPRFPKVDGNGYTKFQLWCFIELYGEHMGLTLPNIIEPLEIVYERRIG